MSINFKLITRKKLEKFEQNLIERMSVYVHRYGAQSPFWEPENYLTMNLQLKRF